MPFKFKVTSVQTLPSAGVGVLAGTVLEGAVLVGQQVDFVHNGQPLPLRVIGVATTDRTRTDTLALHFKLSQPAFDAVQPGDELVSTA